MSMSSYVLDLDDETVNFLRKTLNETDENREECVRKIKQWSLENPKLHVKPDDALLLAFLRACKFNVERSKEKIGNYYKLRGSVPEWFKNRNPHIPEIKEVIRLGAFVPLRKLHNKQLVIIVRTAAHDPKRHTYDHVFKAGKMILDVASKECESAQIFGVSAIFDMKGVGLAHARQLGPSMIRKAVFAWQNYHVRPQKMEFINAPSYVNVVLNIFKSFMSDKLKSRVKVHFFGLGNLHKAVAKDVLPSQYGGCGENLQETIEFWWEKVAHYTEWFEEDEQYAAECS